jgi:predicted permease
MWRHLPVTHPEQLVTLHSAPDLYSPSSSFSYPLFEELRNHVTAISGLSAVYQRSRFIDGGQARLSLVSGDYFETLGVPAALGRTLGQEDERSAIGSRVAVISDSYWAREFHRTSDVVGKAISMNSIEYRIVGVAPSAFTGDEIGIRTDLWIPISNAPDVVPRWQKELLTEPSAIWFRIVGRLNDSTAFSEAEAQLNSALEQARNVSPNGRQAGPLHLERYASGYSGQRRYFRSPLAILMGVVAILLLVACANVANLFLARAVAREKEMALRLSLGAGRTRILRQVLTESLLLATIAGGLSVVISQWLTQGLLALLHDGPFALDLDASLNYHVLAFSATLAAITGLLFGALPAIVASNVAPFSSLKNTGRIAESRRITLGQAMVVSQMGLCALLLIGAGLFVQSFRNLKLQDWGFDRKHVLLVETAPDQIGVEGDSLSKMFQATQRAVESIPGVISASPSNVPLLSGRQLSSPLTVEGYSRKANDPVDISWNMVGPRYFKTLGMRLLSGRDFTDSDGRNSAEVAIINESMALRYFGQSNPIGKRFGLRRQRGNEIEIVGVVGNAKYSFPREDSQDMVSE